MRQSRDSPAARGRPHGGADTHPAPRGGPHTGAGGCALKEAAACGERMWSRLLAGAMAPGEEPHRSRFSGRNSSSWEGPTLAQLVKDCILWEGPHAGAGEEREEEGAAKTKCYQPTPTLIPCPPTLLRVARR